MFKIHAYCCAAQYFAVPSIGAQRRKITPTLIAYISGVCPVLYTLQQAMRKNMQAKIATQTNKDPADTRDYKKPSLHHYSIQAST